MYRMQDEKQLSVRGYKTVTSNLQFILAKSESPTMNVTTK